MWYTILLDKDRKPIPFTVRLHEHAAGDFLTAIDERVAGLSVSDLNRYGAILVVGPSGDGDALVRIYPLGQAEVVVAGTPAL